MLNWSLNHEKFEFHKSKMADGRNVHCRPAGHILVCTLGMVRACYSGILRLTCSRHSQPYSQSGSSDVASGYEFRTICLFCCFNCAVLFYWLATWNRHSSISKCRQLKKTVYQLNRPIHHGGCRHLGDQNKHTYQEVTGITELFEA